MAFDLFQMAMSDAESKMYLIEHAEVILFWLMDETDATHGPDSLITSLVRSACGVA